MKYLQGRIARMSTAGLLAGSLVLSLTACGATTTRGAASEDTAQVEISETDTVSDTSASDVAASETDGSTSLASMSSSGVIATADLFTERDLTQTANLTGATQIALQSGQDVQITAEGVYVISGEATDVTITVEAADDAKVQLVLDGASITNEDFPAIYVKNADKVFVTTTEGSTNVLQVTGTFVADGETNTDAVIFSRDDLVLNGLGTLKLSSTDNAVSCKDDLKVTGGTYEVSATSDAFEANESILVADGTLSVTSGKDAFHAENDEDDTTGFIYVCGGAITINATDDGMQATTYLQIDGGTLDITAAEALEATYVQVNGGDVNVAATDDGVNATTKSASIGTPTIEVTGGTLTVAMGQGDTDALDANGNIVVSGGQIDITGQFAFDFDGTSSFTGGTITVNGEQISEISNSMMMGSRGGGMGHGGPHGGSDSQMTQMDTGETYQG